MTGVGVRTHKTSTRGDTWQPEAYPPSGKTCQPGATHSSRRHTKPRAYMAAGGIPSPGHTGH
eukprot:14540497-Alexandrium_andersonii.AAC.1